MARKNHTYTADPSAPPMLRYQASLPSLPVPTIESTLTKYIQSVTPLLTPAQLAHSQATATAFLASPLAATLQERLQARAADPAHQGNWLAEWWNDAAYMGYRDPVVVFVSYFFVHLAHPDRSTAASSAAQLIKAMLPFRALVESGTLEPEKVRGAPLCMASYKWLFHASRYPTIPSDTATKFSPKEHNHLVAIHKNRFFLVPLTNPTTASELSAAELELQFTRIIQSQSSAAPALPIGALTSDNRDTWTHAREQLAALPGNLASLRQIESAMIIVCLDSDSPITRDEISRAAWVGDGKNRWYDKHQLIVFPNGRSAFLGEHSCMDGTPTLRMNEFVLGSLALKKADLGAPLSPSTPSSLPAPAELPFTTTPALESLIHTSISNFTTLVSSHDLHVAHYPAYGKSLIKTHSISPDAWAQLTKHLAFHKTHHRLGTTYESAQTRKFSLGRTEVIRSASSEAKAFVERMLATPLPTPAQAKELRALFRKAAERHMQYAAWAADGQGVDRHLFGLKKLLKEGEELPELYKDEAYAKSSHWEMSTSQLSSRWFDGWGYGEVVPNGYGLSYSIGDDYIRWTITALKPTPSSPSPEAPHTRETSAEVLKHYLEESATQIRDMMEMARRADEKEAEGKGKL